MQNAHGIVIYDTLPEIVAPGHTCLVVWDVQNRLVDGIFNREAFLNSLKNILSRLRNKIPIVYTIITPDPAGFQSSWRLYSMMRRFNVKEVDKLPRSFVPGSSESQVPGEVKPEEGDVILNKTTASIFIGTNFENLMRNRGITTLIFTGIATEFGVESSARDAANRGFWPVVVSDCVSSSDREAHERSLKNLEKLVIVKSSTEILESIG